MSAPSPLADLRRLLHASPGSSFEAVCQRCAGELPAEHLHLADVGSRSLLCVCSRCHTAANEPRAEPAPHRPVPQRYIALPAEAITEEEWSTFEIPVGIAFFFYNSTLGKSVACYPSPAGAVESLLPADTWANVLRASASTCMPAPDVEALLVRRTREVSECFIVPIDTCYELVGRMRRNWHGFGGGPEVEAEIESHFSAIRARSGQAWP